MSIATINVTDRLAAVQGGNISEILDVVDDLLLQSSQGLGQISVDASPVLFDLVEQAAASTNASSELLEQSAQILDAVLATFGEELPDGGAEQAGLALSSLVDGMVRGQQEGGGRANVSAATISSLVSSASHISATIGRARSEEGASASGALLRSAPIIGDLAAAALGEGEEMSVESESLVLSVARPATEDMDAEIEVGGFQLPPGMLAAAAFEAGGPRALQSCGTGPSLVHLRWAHNPFAFEATADVVGKDDEVQTLEVRRCGAAFTVSGLEEAIKFWLRRDELVGFHGYDATGVPLVMERTCKFWDKGAGRWNSEGCVEDDELANITHVRCHCRHLTSFAAAARSAVCKFCKADLSYLDWSNPSGWLAFQWDEPGVWVLFGLLLVLYAPCILFNRWDRKDWKPIRTNTKAYFKETGVKQSGWECMCLPPFRVCFGLVMCSPVILRCPPCACCRRKNSSIGPPDGTANAAGAHKELPAHSRAYRAQRKAEVRAWVRTVRTLRLMRQVKSGHAPLAQDTPSGFVSISFPSGSTRKTSFLKHTGVESVLLSRALAYGVPADDVAKGVSGGDAVALQTAFLLRSARTKEKSTNGTLKSTLKGFRKMRTRDLKILMAHELHLGALELQRQKLGDGALSRSIGGWSGQVLQESIRFSGGDVLVEVPSFDSHGRRLRNAFPLNASDALPTDGSAGMLFADMSGTRLLPSSEEALRSSNGEDPAWGGTIVCSNSLFPCLAPVPWQKVPSSPPLLFSSTQQRPCLPMLDDEIISQDQPEEEEEPGTRDELSLPVPPVAFMASERATPRLNLFDVKQAVDMAPADEESVRLASALLSRRLNTSSGRRPAPRRLVVSLAAVLRVQALFRGHLARLRVEIKRACRAGEGIAEVTVEVFASRLLGVVECESDEGCERPKARARDHLVAGPIDVFLPIDCDRPVAGSALGFLADVRARATFSFNWRFCPQVCAQHPEGVTFGALELSDPQLQLGNGNLANRTIYVRLTVLVGSKVTQRRFLRPAVIAPGSLRRWPDERHVFPLRRFSEQPLVEVSIGKASSFAEGDDKREIRHRRAHASSRAAFFRIPSERTSDQLRLTVILAVGPAYEPEEKTPSSSVAMLHAARCKSRSNRIAARSSMTTHSGEKAFHGSLFTAYSTAVARPQPRRLSSGPPDTAPCTPNDEALDDEALDDALFVTYTWSPQRLSTAYSFKDYQNFGGLDADGEMDPAKGALGKLKIDLVELPAEKKSSRMVMAPLRDMVVSVDASPPCSSGSQVVRMQVPPGGRLDGEVWVDWASPAQGHEDLEAAAAKYMICHLQQKQRDEAEALARALQFFHWPRKRITLAVLKRESPLTKFGAYSALMSRKQRYATLSSALMVAAMVTVLLFTQGINCFVVPRSVSCKPGKSFFEKFVSWEVLFGSVWGVILASPMPLALLTCFKKPHVLTEHSERDKELRIRIWLWKERVGWLLAILVHAATILASARLVQRYSWALVEVWFTTNVTMIYHRFVTAPLLRSTMVVLVLCLARTTSLADPVVALNPGIANFPGGPPPGGLGAAVAVADPSLPTTGVEKAQLQWARIQATVLSGHAGLVRLRRADRAMSAAKSMGKNSSRKEQLDTAGDNGGMDDGGFDGGGD